MKSGKALLAFAVVAVVGIASCGPWDGYKTYAVDIYAAGHHFQIPRNYFEVHPLTHDPKLSLAANIRVLLPDLQPITEANRSEFEPSSERRLTIHIKREPDSTPGTLNPRRIANLRVDPQAAEEDSRLGMTNVVYAGTGGKQPGGLDYFTTKDERFYMTCTRKTSPVRVPLCSSDLTLRGNIDTYVRFHRTHVNEFPDIIQALEQFLASHEVQQKGNKP